MENTVSCSVCLKQTDTHTHTHTRPMRAWLPTWLERFFSRYAKWRAVGYLESDETARRFHRCSERKNTRTVNAIRLQVEPLESRLPPAILFWTGLGDWESWNDPANWSTYFTPNEDDIVILSAPANPVRIQGDVSVSVFQINRGTLTGNGSLSITQNIVATDSSFGLTGGLKIEPGAQGTFSGIVSFTAGQIDNWGSLVVVGSLNAGDYFFENVGINNYQSLELASEGRINLGAGGWLQNLPSGTLYLRTDAGITGIAPSPPSARSACATFINSGTIVATAMPELPAVISFVSFCTTGNVLVQKGTLSIRSEHASLGGTITLKDYTNLETEGSPILADGGKVVGNGVLSLRRGASVPGSFAASRVELFGQLEVNGNLSITDQFFWYTSTITGSGIIDLLPTTQTYVVRQDGWAPSQTNSHQVNITVTNSGTLTFLGQLFVDVGDSGRIVNAAGGSIFFASDGPVSYTDAGANGPGIRLLGATDQFINNGTLIVEAGRTATFMVSPRIGASLINAGKVELQVGAHLVLAVTKVLNTGTIHLESGSELLVGDVTAGRAFGSLVIQRASLGSEESPSITGSGIVYVSGPSDGGALVVNTDLVIPILKLRGGLSGPGNLTVTRMLEWIEGTMSGSGATIIDRDAVLVLPEVGSDYRASGTGGDYYGSVSVRKLDRKLVNYGGVAVMGSGEILVNVLLPRFYNAPGIVGDLKPQLQSALGRWSSGLHEVVSNLEAREFQLNSAYEAAVFAARNAYDSALAAALSAYENSRQEAYQQLEQALANADPNDLTYREQLEESYWDQLALIGDTYDTARATAARQFEQAVDAATIQYLNGLDAAWKGENGALPQLHRNFDEFLNSVFAGGVTHRKGDPTPYAERVKELLNRIVADNLGLLNLLQQASEALQPLLEQLSGQAATLEDVIQTLESWLTNPPDGNQEAANFASSALALIRDLITARDQLFQVFVDTTSDFRAGVAERYLRLYGDIDLDVIEAFTLNSVLSSITVRPWVATLIWVINNRDMIRARMLIHTGKETWDQALPVELQFLMDKGWLQQAWEFVGRLADGVNQKVEQFKNAVLDYAGQTFDSIVTTWGLNPELAKLYVREFWAGLKDGASIIADTFLAAIDPEARERVKRLVEENGGLYYAAWISAVVSREALKWAGSILTGQWLGRGLQYAVSAVAQRFPEATNTILCAVSTAQRLMQPVVAGQQMFSLASNGRKAIEAWSLRDLDQFITYSFAVIRNVSAGVAALRESGRMVKDIQEHGLAHIFACFAAGNRFALLTAPNLWSSSDRATECYPGTSYSPTARLRSRLWKRCSPRSAASGICTLAAG
jgi:hypothetical protein